MTDHATRAREIVNQFLDMTEGEPGNNDYSQLRSTIAAALTRAAEEAVQASDRVSSNALVQVKYMTGEIAKALKLPGEWSPSDVVNAVRNVVPMVEQIDELTTQLQAAQPVWSKDTPTNVQDFDLFLWRPDRTARPYALMFHQDIWSFGREPWATPEHGEWAKIQLPREA